MDFDICILALGTNDAQFFYNLTKKSVKEGVSNLISSCKEANPKTNIIIVPPVKITQSILKSSFSLMFDKHSIEKIQEVFPVFYKTAQDLNCEYFDFNEIATPSKLDGLHYEENSHKLIAQKLAEFIKSNY